MSGTSLSFTEVKEFVTFLRDQGVMTFEGYGMRLEFRPDQVINPFAISDPEERRKAVLESFKKQSSDNNDEDLLWSTEG